MKGRQEVIMIEAGSSVSKIYPEQKICINEITNHLEACQVCRTCALIAQHFNCMCIRPLRWSNLCLFSALCTRLMAFVANVSSILTTLNFEIAHSPSRGVSAPDVLLMCAIIGLEIDRRNASCMQRICELVRQNKLPRSTLESCLRTYDEYDAPRMTRCFFGV